MTDVWTSGGVLAGVGLVAITKWQPLDSIVAILVALNIVSTGFGIIRKSVQGLMDGSLNKEDLGKIQEVLNSFNAPEVQFHNLRTRLSGSTKFISFHVLVPGVWNVTKGHKLVSSIEKEMEEKISNSVIFTHLESVDDPYSMDEVILNTKQPK